MGIGKVQTAKNTTGGNRLQAAEDGVKSVGTKQSDPTATARQSLAVSILTGLNRSSGVRALSRLSVFCPNDRSARALLEATVCLASERVEPAQMFNLPL